MIGYDMIGYNMIAYDMTGYGITLSSVPTCTSQNSQTALLITCSDSAADETWGLGGAGIWNVGLR